MREKVLVLPRSETKAAGARPPRAKGPLRHRAAQRAFIGAQLAGQFLDGSHAPMIMEYVRYMRKSEFAPRNPRYSSLMRPVDSR